MKVNISLSKSSLRNAIKQIKAVKKTIETKMTRELLKRSCQWIKERAIHYLETSGLGVNVIREISGQFQIIYNGNSAILRNGEGRGYMIEFGVGIAGAGTYDGVVAPNYQYNISTAYKNEAGEWIFKTTDEDLDIPNSHIINRTTNTAKTAGGEGVMFMYQALTDFRSQQQAKRIWRDICEEYIN